MIGRAQGEGDGFQEPPGEPEIGPPSSPPVVDPVA